MEAPHRGMLTEKTPQRIKCKAGWWELCTLSAVSTHETRAAGAHTIRDWSRFESHKWRQDLVAFQAFLTSIFCCFFATSAGFGKWMCNTPLSNFASTFAGSGSNGRGIARLNEP